MDKADQNASDSGRQGPCTNIRVLDMTSVVSGPLCSQILADLGAEVIRVESAGSDVMRNVAPLQGDMGAYFEQLNRGKKSLAVDVKSEAGKDLVTKLASTVDVFVQNSRPGAMERLGLGYEDLKKINSGLVYVSITGFGEHGPYVKRPAYDTVIQGITGFMPIQGGGDSMASIRAPVADKITGMAAANAALAALLRRANGDGRGQKVEINMVSAYSAFVLVDQMHNHTFLSADFKAEAPARHFHRTLRTSDGEVVGHILQPNQFKGFCIALGFEQLIDDPRFADSPSLVENVNVFYDLVEETVARFTSDEFIDLMNRHGVPFGHVNTVAEFLESAEAKSAEAYVDIEDPEYGPIRHVNYPARFERTPTSVRRRAPKFGEHNEEITERLQAISLSEAG